MKQHATVLVVDDELGMREMLAYELSQEGFDVQTADSGMSAIEAMKKRKFDLAITDLNMPGMTGVETVEALRAIDPDIQVIVATGYATVETAVACMKHGAYDYIQKPYELDQIALLLERAMEHGTLQGVVALYEASRTLLSTLNFSELTDLVMDLTRSVLRASKVELSLHGQPHELRAAHGPNGIPDKLVRKLAEISIAKDGPVRIPTPTQHWPADTPKDFTSALVYPLITRARTIGHLAVVRTGGQPHFSESELRRGAIFAGQIALSLDNARLHEELEAKIQELIETREQLVQAEKLAAVSQLASLVGHEVNNPLAIVQANLDVLRDYSTTIGGLWLAAKATAESLRKRGKKEDLRLANELLAAGDRSGEDTESLVSEIADMINDILGGVKRIAELVAGFQRMTEPLDPTTREQFDVATLVRSCLQEAGGDAVAHESCGGPGNAWAAPADIRTAIGHILSFLTSRRVGPHSAVSLHWAFEGDRAVLSIADPALKLSEVELLRIFDPKLSVNQQQGTTMRLDLGLGMAHQLLFRNDASFKVTGSSDQGVVFRIDLPVPKDDA